MKMLVFEADYRFFGGAEQSLLCLLRGLQERHPDIEVVVLAPGEGEFVTRVEQAGIPTVHIRYNRLADRFGSSCVLGRIGLALGWIVYCLQTLPLLLSSKWDIVYCNTLRSVLTLGLAAKLTRHPILWYVRLDEVPSRLGNWLALWLSSYIVFIGEELTKRFSKSQLRKLRHTVIHTGFPMPEVWSRKKREHPAKARIAVVANIRRRKNQLDALKAVANLRKRCSGEIGSVWLVGRIDDLQYKEELDDFIEKSELTGMVRFIGWVENVSQIYRDVDILLLTSLNEGLPRAVLEGMSYGIPPVTYDVGAVREAVTHDIDGFVVPVKDIAGVTRCLEKLVCNVEQRFLFGSRARETIRRKFAVERYSEEFAEFIRHVVTNG